MVMTSDSMTSGSPDIDALVLVDDGRRWLRLTRPQAVLVARLARRRAVAAARGRAADQGTWLPCRRLSDVRGRRRVRAARRSVGQPPAAGGVRAVSVGHRLDQQSAGDAANRPASAARGRRGIARHTSSASIGSSGTSPTATRIRSTAPSRSRRRSTAKRARCSARSCGRSAAGTRRGCASVTSRSARRPPSSSCPAAGTGWCRAR